MGGRNTVYNLKGISVSGKNPFSTSLNIMREFFRDSSNIVVTSGENFSDALCAISLTKRYNSPILLSYEKVLNRDIFEFFRENYKNIILVGGRIDKNIISLLMRPNNIQINYGGDIRFFEPHGIDDKLKGRIVGNSYKINNKLSIDNLSYVPVLHRNLKGEVEFGELIVNKSIGKEVGNIFKEIYNNSIPIEKIRLVDEYNSNDVLSMEDNNT